MEMERVEVKQHSKAYGDRMQRKRMKSRTHGLFIEPLSPTTCRVWGGENEHIVTFKNDTIQCDCSSWKEARNGNCSHVMMFRITYGDLSK